MRSKRANFYRAPYSNIDLFLNENTMIHVHCSRYIPDGVIISYELPFILKFIYPVESYLGYKSANLFSVLLLLQSDIRFFFTLFVEQCGLHSNLQSPPHLPRFAFCFDTGIYIMSVSNRYYVSRVTARDES